VLQTARGATYSIAQRAEHIWEGVSSATTRSRPIINTRDEPHADAEKYRRLHVIVGDSNMSEYTDFVKVGAAACMLRMLEDPNVVLRDMTLENPIRAIREISHDITCRRTVRLANGREVSALDIQREYLDRALRYADSRGSPRWSRRRSRCGSTASRRSRRTRSARPRGRLGDQVQAARGVPERHDLPFGHPRVQLLDLQYHDVSRTAEPVLQAPGPGLIERICTDDDIAQAIDVPPQTTRARLRGDFVKRAKERKRDYTVDWVHLKLNDQAQRTVLCKDPFKSRDERVERLIESL
jgi:proteasome accessory factor A